MNGNLETKTAKVAGACTGDVTTYIWNAQNQLIQIDFPDLTTAAYRYDGFGRRIEKDVAGVITRYVYYGEDILLEYDGANTLLARYSNGELTDQPFVVERGGQSFFYQADHQGSVTQITDAAGFVVNAYEYDSYGNIESAVEGVPNPFTYTAREFDAESGFYYYRARYYDLEIGRFLKEDPIGFAAGDVSLYRYVFNNPVNLIDPDGLQVLPMNPAIGMGIGPAGANPQTNMQQSERAARALEKLFKDAFANASENLKNLFRSVMGSVASEGSSDDATSASPSDEMSCDDDDFCFIRWGEESARCSRWYRFGINHVLGCQARADDRHNLCVANGGTPHPLEPPEYGFGDVFG